MLDPTHDLVPPTSSPTISSVSSSDLDTESTGSFFHDRSTTLGTLMGVNFPAITFRAPSQHRDPNSAAATGFSGGSRMRSATKSKPKKKKRVNAVVAPPDATADRRRRWWRLCRDGDSKPASLGDFLEVERRFGDGAFYGTAAELEGMVGSRQRNNNNERILFADGRVLPPADLDEGRSMAGSGSLCTRFPTGICSGGVG